MRSWLALVLAAIGLTACDAATASRPTLVLKPCTIDRGQPAECGVLQVPEDRTQREGRLINLNVAVLRGQSQSTALFLLSGGPGQSAMAMAPMAGGWLAPLRDSMDIVFVDQRGTSSSHLLACPADVERDPAAAFGPVLYRQVLRTCQQAFEGRLDATKYTTEDAVADLEEARERLGYEQVALFGVSYGSRLAQAYLRRHPARVRAVVLDGVAPLDLNLPLTHARSLQRALDLVIGADREASTAFASLLERLDRAPVQATVTQPTGRLRVPMSRLDFLYAVRGMLYQETGVVDLADQLRHAARIGALDAFAQRRWERARRMQATLAHGLHLSVYCAEDVPFATEEAIARETQGTALGRALYDEYAAACRLWPSKPVVAELRAPPTAPVPVLLVSGHYDPVTPPEFGDRVARSLPRSGHIVVSDGAHGSSGRCPQPAVLHILREGTLDGLPDVCR